MEAKDTVMNEAQLIALLTFDRDSVLLGQAEITWPIAEKAGIREVVEWIQMVPPVGKLPEGNMKHYAISTEQWQAKLKEWGL